MDPALTESLLNMILGSYCVKGHHVVWAMPVYILANLSFVLAGLYTYRRYLLFRRDGFVAAEAVHAVAWIIAAIGILGIYNYFFRSVPTLWAQVSVIMAYVFGFFTVFIRYVIGLKWKHVMLGLLTFVVVNFINIELHDPQEMNGAVFYLPVLLVLVIFSAHLHAHNKAGTLLFIQASVLFMFAVFLRMMDANVCARTGMGTMVLWLVCTSASMAFLSEVLARNVLRHR
ncbi:MAG: hypothetical protein ACOYJ2_00060 [Rickettsiales bacterium]